MSRPAKKLIHVHDDRGRLHCDNVDCGHILEQPLKFGPHLIGYQCPVCSTNMLTAKDFAASERMFAAIEWINRWFGWLGRRELVPGEGFEVGIRHHDGRTIIDGPQKRQSAPDDRRTVGSL